MENDTRIDIGLACDGLYVTIDEKRFFLDQEDFTDGKVLLELLTHLGHSDISFSECF